MWPIRPRISVMCRYNYAATEMHNYSFCKYQRRNCDQTSPEKGGRKYSDKLFAFSNRSSRNTVILYALYIKFIECIGLVW